MNLLVELSNGEIEEVEVDDCELVYHEFWGNEESMAEAQEILYELQQQCASMSADVAELRAYVRAKFENYDTNTQRFYDQTLPTLDQKLSELQKRMAEQEKLDAVDTTKMNWVLGSVAFVVGSALTALVGSLF